METPVSINTVIFIVLLIVPGVFFKRFYFQGEFTKQFGSGTFADRFITSIFWGLFVQAITFLLFSTALDLRLETLTPTITGAYKDLTDNKIPNFARYNLWLLFSYLCMSIAVPVVLGTLLHKIVRALKIDTKFLVFRFSNQWNYYFKGDILASSDFKSTRTGKVLSTSVDVIMDGGTDKPKMFTGILAQYVISKTGELETLFLTNAQRWSETTKSFKTIPGDMMIIPYNRVIDLNVRYHIKLVTQSRRKLILTLIEDILLYAIILIIVTYPWFLGLSIPRTVVGIADSLAALVVYLVLISEILKKPTKRLFKARDFYFIGSAFIFLLIVSILTIWLPQWGTAIVNLF